MWLNLQMGSQPSTIDNLFSSYKHKIWEIYLIDGINLQDEKHIP